jgi:V/A-type H+-transporting ATPase subunit C
LAGIGYAFISAYLKGEEARMVHSGHAAAFASASSYDDVVEAIRDTDIGSYLEGLDIQTFDELDDRLWTYFSGCLSRIEWFKSVPRPARELLNAYIARYDILNIKTALQNILSGNRTGGIPAGIVYNNNALEDLLNAENLDTVISVLDNSKLSRYTGVLEEYRTDDGFRKEVLTDTGLEQVYFKELLEVTAKMKDSNALLTAFRTMLDMTNLQIVMRAVISESSAESAGRTIDGGYLLSDNAIKELLSLRAADIPSRLEYPHYRTAAEEIMVNYERDGNISVIDEIIDNHKSRIISETLSPRIMSPAVIVWYLILKENELRNIRLVLKVVLDNISPEEIKEYLVFSS